MFWSKCLRVRPIESDCEYSPCVGRVRTRLKPNALPLPSTVVPPTAFALLFDL